AQVLAARLQRLRSVWLKQDRPETAYDDGKVPLLPLIDPDVIGPEDCRQPVAKAHPTDPDQAFDLWVKRRNWIDTQLQGLTALVRTGMNVPDINALFTAMGHSFSYAGTSIQPWASSTPPSAFGTLLDSLDRETDVAATQDRLARDLGLSVARF